MVRLVLLRLLESFFRHRWLNLLPIVLMSVLAVVFVMRSPPTYVSGGILYVQSDTLLSTLVPVGDSGGFSWSTPANTTASEIRELMQTEYFMMRVIERIPVLQSRMQEGPEVASRTIWQFREAVSLNELGEKLVGFSAKHEDPILARDMALAIIQAYSEWKFTSEREDIAVAQEFFGKQLGPYQDALDQAKRDLKAYIDAHPAPSRGDRPDAEQAEVDRLQGMVDAASQRVNDTLAKEEEAGLALAKIESQETQSYRIIDAPREPTDSEVSLKDMVMDGVIFVVLGIALSLMAIVGNMLLDRTLRFPVDVANGLNLPLLAMVPVIRVSAPQPLTAEERQFLQARMMISGDLQEHDDHLAVPHTAVDLPVSSDLHDITRSEEVLAQPAHTSERILLPQSI